MSIISQDAAIRLALENNPDIRMLSADIASARGEVTTARTWQNPEISVAPGFKTIRDPSVTEFHGDFGLEQTFEWPGKRSLRRAVAEKNVGVRQLALAGFRSQLAIQVRRAYFTLLATRGVVELREQKLTLVKSFVEAAKKKVEGGFAPEFEAMKAEVEMVGAQRVLREAQGARGPLRADDGDVHGWQAYVLQVDERDTILAALRAQGIEAQIGTYALHGLGAYRDQGPFPGAARVFERALALPFHTRLEEGDLDRVAAALDKLVSHH